MGEASKQIRVTALGIAIPDQGMTLDELKWAVPILRSMAMMGWAGPTAMLAFTFAVAFDFPRGVA